MLRNWKIMIILTMTFLCFQNFTPLPDSMLHLGEFKPLCSELVKQNFLNSSDANVNLNCSLYLKANDVLNKNITIKGSENSKIFVRCEKGAKINGFVRVLSVKLDKITNKPVGADTDPALAVWSAPQDIEIKGCETKGFRVSGIKSVGESHSDDMRYSSYFENHTQNAQNSAPKNIIFTENTIFVSGPTPVYFDMGVTNIIFSKNTLNGSTENVVMYLDAESAFITVDSNTFNVNSVVQADKSKSRMRETIAIDGSANNRIVNNKFIGRNSGSIHIYRNCGEKGLVRHQLPHSNLIKSNEFKGSYANEADIVVDPRYNKVGDFASFCWQDRKLDLNKIYEVIKEVVPNYSEEYPDKSSIYMKAFTSLPIEVKTIIENASVYPFGSSLNNSSQIANNSIIENKLKVPISVQAGDLKSNNIRQNILEVSGDCQKNQSNEGCQFALQCPVGMVAKNVKAACNLEWGGISDTQFAAAPENRIKIIVDSGNTENRLCSVNGIKAKIMSNPLDQILGQSNFVFTCRDFEGSGGDCAMRARLKCTEL